MSIEELERLLKLAQERARDNIGDIRQRLAALEAVSEAERALAAAKGLPYATPLDIGVVPEAAVSDARLVQTEYQAVLTFSATKREANGRRLDSFRAVIEFVRCTATMFGYPNDEALPGHPLYNAGLSAYGFFEAIGSRWIRQLTQRNRVALPSIPDSTQRHFIFTFHDSTFECIANDLKISVQPASDAMDG